jgi:micrococcal nuclease
MRWVFLLLLACSSMTQARSKRGSGGSQHTHEKHDTLATLVVNGERTDVRWTDGDSFKFLSGPYKGRGTRLNGYNTLEAYGPVHRWGEWTTRELYTIALGASQVAASQTWECTTDGNEDGYHRVLVRCPEAAKKMVSAGVAMAYDVDGKADPELVELMHEAMRGHRGMWEKGAADGIISSLHSVGEDGDGKPEAYNRVVDTRTGAALTRVHQKTYGLCEEVCEETNGTRSCMVYVPFARRYKTQPDCLD